jgi:DNA-binding CsgD family transcriptional regulator
MNLLEAMHRSVDGVFAIDEKQNVVFWNQACEDLTGIPAAIAIGSACQTLLKGEDAIGRPICRSGCPVGALASGGPPPTSLCMRITHADGQRKQLSVGTLLYPSQRDGLWHVVHVLRPGRQTQSMGAHEVLGQHGGGRLPDLAAQCIHPRPGLAQLTCREREILRLLAEGLSTLDICSTLHLSHATVRNHIQHLMEKMKVHSRLEAVAYAKHQLQL